MSMFQSLVLWTRGLVALFWSIHQIIFGSYNVLAILETYLNNHVSGVSCIFSESYSIL